MQKNITCSILGSISSSSESVSSKEDGSQGKLDMSTSSRDGMVSDSEADVQGDSGPADVDYEAAEENPDAVNNDPVRDMVMQAKERTRVKTDNLKVSTSDYLEKTKPENTKKSIKTSVNAMKDVLKVLHPEETRDLTELPNETLADYLEEFFMSVLRKDGSTYNASTLGTYYNGLARYFVDVKKLDIKKEPEFVRVSQVLSRRQEESVKEGKIPGENASKPIPLEVLVDVVAQGNIGLDSPRALTANVIQCFEVGFGIRSGAEMYEIRNGDIKIGPMKQNGIPEYIELGERMTKKRRGSRCQGKLKKNFDYKLNLIVQDPDNLPPG